MWVESLRAFRACCFSGLLGGGLGRRASGFRVSSLMDFSDLLRVSGLSIQVF